MAAIAEIDTMTKSTSHPISQQEPAAWICAEWSGTGAPTLSFDGPPQQLSVRDEVTNPVWTPLYTMRRIQPLTADQVWGSDEIMTVNAAVGLAMYDLMMLVRAVEQAHGIT